MNKAQSLRRYIRNQEALADWFLWKLFFTAFCTFFTAHTHQFIILGKSFFKDLILLIVVIKKRFHRKAERMTFVCSWSSNQCHIQDRTFYPALLDLGKMSVADADCNRCKNCRGNVVGRVVMAFVYLTDDALDFCREYADWKICASQSHT